MTAQLQALPPGSTVSYPAGSSDLDHERFRVVGFGGDRLAQALRLFPQLLRLFNGAVPLILGCYPAALGNFPSAVFLDTYLRPVNFFRGLALAAARDMTAIVITQPLIIAELLVQAVRAGVHFPQRMLLASGGYPMPASLERFILRLLATAGCQECDVLHAYGVAEVDFGILAAIRQPDGRLIYRVLADDVQVRIHAGRIELRKAPASEWLQTPDRAVALADGFEIIGNSERVDAALLAELERWDDECWRRYTGRLGQGDRGLLWQLREGESAPKDGEISFHTFFERFGDSILDKPVWRLSQPMSRGQV